MPEARCGTTVARISVDRKSTASDGAALRELLAPDAAIDYIRFNQLNDRTTMTGECIRMDCGQHLGETSAKN